MFLYNTKIHNNNNNNNNAYSQFSINFYKFYYIRHISNKGKMCILREQKVNIKLFVLIFKSLILSEIVNNGKLFWVTGL